MKISIPNKINIVAEIGCNHMGKMQLAKKMIILAKKAGADYVKFQKRDNKVLLSKKQFNEKHPVEKNSFGTHMESTENFWNLVLISTKTL